MQIAVVGAGPAGIWVSNLLAQRGHTVTLIDSQAPWEKPCGGGVTTKALTSFGIFQSDLPRNNIDHVTIYFGDSRSVTVRPKEPIAVLSRRELARHLLQEAEKSGVSLLKSRVNQIERLPRGWRLTTREGTVQSDFLIGADGASSLVRRCVSTGLQAEDLCVTIGYFIPGHFAPQMKIYFLPSFDGYLWSFPRPTHTSYGLITRSTPGWTARAKMLLANFIAADLGEEVMQDAEFYSAPVPCLRPETWRRNQIAGDGWALVGDAAGLVDPITGEGIYYAFKSAQLLAETVGAPDQYRTKVDAEIGRELARASRIYKRFYNGRFLGADFKKRTVQLAQRSRTIKTILGNLISGNQSYLTLKRKLVFSIPSIGVDLIARRSNGMKN
jgi:geranylgeranyl reductase family protein